MVPTLGASAVVTAMQLCDQVSLAGFGYDMQHPQARLHYYETIHMDAMKAQVRFSELIKCYSYKCKIVHAPRESALNLCCVYISQGGA